MSHNRDVPAYQEYAATILAQLPSSAAPRLHITQSPKGRTVIRREVMQSAYKIAWSYPALALLGSIFTNCPSDHQTVTTEQNSWNCGTRESTRELTEDSSGKPLKTCPASPDRFCVEATD